MLTLRCFGAVVVLVVFSGQCCAQTPEDDAQTVAAAPVATATPEFEPRTFLRAFREGTDEQKLAALEYARASRDQQSVHRVLRQVIRSERRANPGSPILMDAVELFCDVNNRALFSEQIALARSKHTGIALVATATLARRHIPEALDRLLELSRHPDFARSFGLRRSVADGVARFGERRAIDWLVETHAKHDGLLRFVVAQHLERLTGQEFGGDPQQWQVWWAEHRRTFDPAAVQAKPQQGKNDPVAWPVRVPSFFDLPIYGHRVLFVIDESRSMLSSVDGATRMEDVQRELEKVILEMPEGTWLNVMGYNEQLEWWQPRFVEATPAARADAIRFVSGLQPELKTKSCDALEAALQHNLGNLEMIIFVSDGKPTAGRVVERSTIVRLITRQNRLSNVSINAIGIDARGKELAFLKSLTTRNQGQLRTIR